MRDLIRLEGVGFRHRGSPRPVLEDISLTVREGDRILIRGASGSGKSTLLQILAGLAPEYATGELSGSREILYSVKGIVLQNPEAQIVTPTVEEEAAFALENAGMDPSEIRLRVEATLRRLGMSGFAERHPLTLSGGECQRVSLAAALAQQPEVLFLDEPTAYLDEESAQRFFESLALLPDRTAIIVVEHKIRAAAEICSLSYEVTKDGRLSPSDFHPGTDLPGFSAPFHFSPADRGASPAALEVRGLGHRFTKDSPAVFSDAAFSVAHGEIVALMGPSGCGKTTLLGKITRILPIDLETVFFGGRDAANMKDRDFNSSFLYVPQNPEHLFVADSTEEELRLSGEKALSLARRFGLEKRLSANPYRLSEGEKRRLNICVALAEARPLYLLDEPTYGLDDSSRALLAEDIKSLAEQGAAVLFVTHDADFAKAVAARILVMKEGIVQKRGVDDVGACKTA